MDKGSLDVRNTRIEVGTRQFTREAVRGAVRAEQLFADLLRAYLEAMALWCDLCTAHASRADSYARSRGIALAVDAPGQAESDNTTE